MRFTAELLQVGNNTGIAVPEEVLETLGGGKRPRVSITIKALTFSLTLGSMKGKTMIPISAERRAIAGLVGGNTYEIEIALDTSPQVITIPDDLSHALKAAGAMPAFDKLPPSQRKEHARAINDAKTDETRTRRISKVLEKLAAH